MQYLGRHNPLRFETGKKPQLAFGIVQWGNRRWESNTKSWSTILESDQKFKYWHLCLALLIPEQGQVIGSSLKICAALQQCGVCIFHSWMPALHAYANKCKEVIIPAWHSLVFQPTHKWESRNDVVLPWPNPGQQEIHSSEQHKMCKPKRSKKILGTTVFWSWKKTDIYVLKARNAFSKQIKGKACTHDGPVHAFGHNCREEHYHLRVARSIARKGEKQTWRNKNKGNQIYEASWQKPKSISRM